MDEQKQEGRAIPEEERAWLKHAALQEDIAHFEPGLYLHYKGGFYTALALVTHHEARMPMVLYVSHTYGGSNVRPLVGWEGDPDGWNDWVEHGGKTVRRFKFVGDLPSNTPISERGNAVPA
jgi:hypothetical protein